MNRAEITQFQKQVWAYYYMYARDLPWRQPEPDGSFDEYKILVSELMLQQTQVSRVIPKYRLFLAQFPDMKTLAKTSLSNVLVAWSGLGYNRRAKYLHDAAKQLASKETPWKLEDLRACKGIGSNTAAAITAYAYNQPVVFIETNIRSVYIHHFFNNLLYVSDNDILELVKLTLPHREGQPERSGSASPGAISGSPAKKDFHWGEMRNPRCEVSHYREWYWALMDYGSHLKTSAGNVSHQSKHHIKQSRFEGSTRQIRGQVLRLLVKSPSTLRQFRSAITDERLHKIMVDLEKEKLIRLHNGHYFLAT